MADKCQPEFNRAIKACGIMEIWLSCIDFANRPDVCVIWTDKGNLPFYIEYKSVHGSLKIRGDKDDGGWRQGQIDYAEWHIANRPTIPTMLGVMVYDVTPAENRSTKRMYLVPTSVALDTVYLFDGIQKSIPYRNPRLKELKENRLYFEYLWRNWKVNRVKGGWDIKPILIRALRHEGANI